MRKFFIIAFVLIIGAVWGFDIAEYVGPNETVSNITYIDMAGPDGAYVLYYLNNEPIMMVKGEEVVRDIGTVKAVLERYYFNKDFPTSEELSNIKEVALAFNKSRENVYSDGRKLIEPPEKICWKYTGLVVRKCDINETKYHPCLLSCGASPLCTGSILEGGITSAKNSRNDFLDAILSFQMSIDGIEDDINTIFNRVEKLSGLEYSKFSQDSLDDLSDLIYAARDIKKRYNKLSGNILFSDLMGNVGGLQSYCPPLNYSSLAVDELESLANTYEARTADLYNVDVIASDIINKTLYREQLRVRMNTESEYGARFNAIDAKYDDLYSKYVKVSKYINDTTLKSDIETLKGKRDSARNDIYTGNFSRADLTMKQFGVLAVNFEEKVDKYFNETNEIEEIQEEAEKKIIIAEWDLEVANIFLQQQLTDVKMKKASLDAKIANRLSPEEIEDVIQQYTAVVVEIDEIIQVKREHALDTFFNKVVGVANQYSYVLSSTYVSVSGGGYQQMKQIRDFVLPATLVMVDLVAVSAFMAGFIYMVASGKIRLHKIAAVLWSFIFIAFFTVVGGGSIASYVLINEKTNKATFDTFYFDLLAANESAVIVDARAGEVSDECATMLVDLFSNQMNKTTYLYRYGLDGCELKSVAGSNLTNTTIDTGKISIDACDERLEKMPKVFVRRAERDSTTFSLKYSTSAIISGSDEYMKQCKLGVILSEEV